MMMRLIERLGSWAVDTVQEMGRMLLFVTSSFAWLVRPPFRMAWSLQSIGDQSKNGDSKAAIPI